MSTQQKSVIRGHLDKMKNEKYFNVVGKINDKLLGQIQNQIVSKKFTISDQKTHLVLQKSSEKDYQHTNRKLNEILQKKQQMIKQLNNIQQQQLIIKKHSQPNLSGVHKVFKSQNTQQEKQKIKKIKQALKKFQKELQHKTKTIQQKQKKYLQQAKQLQEKRKNQKWQQRKQQTEKRFDQINKRHTQRQIKFDQDKKRMAQIKNKKYFFQQLQDKWKNHIQQQQKEKQRMKEEFKRKNNVNLEDIKYHSRKYQQIIRRNKQQRQKRSLQFNQYCQINTGRYSPSRFQLMRAEEDQKRRQQQQQRKNQAKKFNDKRLAYADKIRKTYKFKTIQKPISEQKQQDNKKLPHLRSLSVLDKYKKGNQYMKQVHSNIGSIQIQKSKVSQAQTHPMPIKYKDYLKDAKMARTLKQGSSTQHNNKQIDQIKKIMKKQNITQQQKFFKARIVASKIQGKSGDKAKNLVQSINAKIEILKQLQV